MTEIRPIDYVSDQVSQLNYKRPCKRKKRRKFQKGNMAIYELFEQEHVEDVFEGVKHASEENIGKHFFSTLVTRFCFLLLFIADSAWLIYNTIMMVLFAFAHVVTGRKIGWLDRMLRKFALSFRRSVVCGLSLLVGLFSPPFGIMVACTYFLMYDKAGMEEVVPAPLQSQFKDIFKT